VVTPSARAPSKGEGDGARIVYESAGRTMILATLGGVFITIHRKDYTAEEFAPLHRYQLAFAQECGVPIGVLTILDVTERHILRFKEEAREATVALVREMTPFMRCSAVVFDRGGFAASALRSLVTTINLLSRQPYPSRVFGDLDAALEWMEPSLDKLGPRGFSRAAAAEWVRQLRTDGTAPGRTPGE
jgi:hypothetical protein